MKTILITSVGSVSGSVVIETLKNNDCRVIGCGIYPREYVVDAINTHAYYMVPRTIDWDEYMDAVLKICKHESVNYIVALTDLDVDFFNVHRSIFEDNGIYICISPKHSLDVIRDKKKLADFITEECDDVSAIPTVRMSEVDYPSWTYPLVCKPYNGRSSQGLKYVHNKNEWEAIKKEVDESMYIVQPFIKGSVVVADTVRHPKSGRSVVVCRRELIATPHGCGLTVQMYSDSAFEDSICKLASKLDIWGCVNFECMYDDNGQYYIIECNPRFSAGVKFSCMTGYDCVSNHIRCFADDDIDEEYMRKKMIIARRYEEFVTHCEE